MMPVIYIIALSTNERGINIMKDLVPEKFYKGDIDKPQAQNVGDLKKLLDELPDHLNIEQGFDKGVTLVVFNIRNRNPHLSFQENEI
jgi:hypothetical protein